ncbi:uncharacterized protein TNCT_227131 [Trichonephila clavata]|uniref:Uncharacterized protein n=1 Tax=Trichonephila clavata TaxID=2740835 RepID=A0A8X6LNJ0_TRICU|nr:uncharacterized protein TNCT_227131 [Trichonephila clavata]
MTIHFWPTLQLLAYARIARGILYTFELEILKNRFITGSFSAHTDYLKRIEEKVSEILYPAFTITFSHLSVSSGKSEGVKHLVLPTEIQNKLIYIILELCAETRNWYESHSMIFHRYYLDLRNKLSWFSFGIIDRFETARNYIQDKYMSMEERFHFACRYYFENDVQILWANMSPGERFYAIKTVPRTRSMELLLEMLHECTPLNWSRISTLERRNFFLGNYLGIRSYFTKLIGSDTRYMCIFSALQNKSVHHFDLYLCLTRINDNELNNLLTRLPMPAMCELLQSFLDWPLQIMFEDVVNAFKPHINGGIFRHLIKSLVLDKLRLGLQENLYVDPLDSFWNPVSAKYKNHLKQEELYSLVRNALESSHPLGAKKFLFPSTNLEKI